MKCNFILFNVVITLIYFLFFAKKVEKLEISNQARSRWSNNFEG